MPTNQQLIDELLQAREYINSVLDSLASTSVPPTTIPIKVLSGDNLPSLVDLKPADSIFDIDRLFIQEISDWTINKPTWFRSSGGKLIGSINVKAPNVNFTGMKLEGIGGTILQAGPRTIVESCELVGSNQGQQRGISVNNPDIAIVKTKITNIWKDIDTQAICGWNKTKNLLIQDCDLEASGENIMFGGADSDSIDNIPQGIVIDNCRLFKRLLWREQPGVTAKNLFELKSVKNLVMKNCTLEYSWASGQVGYGIVLSVRNQNGLATWSTIDNVLIEGNTIKHVGGGITILGRDDINVSQIMNGVTFRNNVFDDVNRNVWGGTGRQVQISGAPKYLTLDGNTFNGVGLNSAISFDQPQYKCEGLVVRDNSFIEGNYGIFGTNVPSAGLGALEMYAPGYIWERNKVTKSGVRNIVWPVGTIFA